ncbi:TonB-dependent receptor plug domain-containing protein [Roseibacillus ishigakijimensis]|uniref:TonB-dependent receptor n=1 Tax=Roseibacillus ishigakijimensis TaxID=454146 RepID=A0A934VM39_9BACT|nr:TonB-dependent receptor [Roseibacillus ishigakijimensis]MBK1833701.1 TonB-dependent receptor [Roseibacillus ishigakijimensis]
MRYTPLLFCIPASLTAQDVLRDTVVTASRVAEDSRDTPYSTEVITSGEYLDQGFRTLPEAFELTPGVSVQKTTHGHGSPFIRGFTGRQNLYLIDGVRLNNSTFRSGPVQYANTIDGFALDRLELIKSQGSVLYGSDALGGTVNSITIGSGYREAEAGFFQHGSALYRFDTNSNSQIARVQQSIGEGGIWGLTLGGTWKDFGDIESNAFGKMKGTGYPEQNLDLKFEWSPSADFHLTLAHQQLNQDEVNRWHSTENNPGNWEGLSPGTFPARVYDQERSLTYLKVEHDLAKGPVDSYTATFSYQTAQDSEFQNRGPSDIRNQVIETETYGVSLVAESELVGSQLLYGLDYYEDEIESRGRRTGRDPRSMRPLADDSEYRSLGIFAQARTPWNDQFETTAGLRYTYSEAELGKVWTGSEDISADDDWNSLVFNVRALYHFNETWTAFGGVSQGFRAPNVNDLSGNLTTRNDNNALGSLDLDPEKTWTFELGTRARADRFAMESAVFYTLIDDIITSVPETPGSSTTITTNGSEAWLVGAEAEASYRLTDCLTLSGFLTYQYGDADRVEATNSNREITEPLSRLSPLRGSLALRYEPGNWWAEARLIAAARANRLSEDDKDDTQRIPPGGTPAYLTASLSGGWQVSENLDVSIALQNLFDEDYRVHGSGVNGAGFGALLTTRYRW